MFCSDPPERPNSGTWEWNGDLEYSAEAYYTCGFYGKFEEPDTNRQYELLTSVCGWNKTWVPQVKNNQL